MNKKILVITGTVFALAASFGVNSIAQASTNSKVIVSKDKSQSRASKLGSKFSNTKKVTISDQFYAGNPGYKKDLNKVLKDKKSSVKPKAEKKAN